MITMTAEELNALIEAAYMRGKNDGAKWIYPDPHETIVTWDTSGTSAAIPL